GVWDIFYYVFLRVLTGWPKSLLDWDILFLIPLPWWGPVWAPVSIALLMILWGTFMTKVEWSPISSGSHWKFLALGRIVAALALFTFMADAIRTADQGTDALRTMLPVRFNWPLFGVALALMTLPLADVARQNLDRKSTRLNSSHVSISYAVFCLKKKKSILGIQRLLNVL